MYYNIYIILYVCVLQIFVLVIYTVYICIILYVCVVQIFVLVHIAYHAYYFHIIILLYYFSLSHFILAVDLFGKHQILSTCCQRIFLSERDPHQFYANCHQVLGKINQQLVPCQTGCLLLMEGYKRDAQEIQKNINTSRVTRTG